jgi:hypothetical protein
MLVRAKAPHKVVTAFTGQRITIEWLPVPDGCEAEAERLASADFVELREQTEAKPEPKPLVEQVAEPEPGPVFIDEPEPLELSNLPTKELRRMAKAAGVSGYARMSKAKLLEALNE